MKAKAKERVDLRSFWKKSLVVLGVIALVFAGFFAGCSDGGGNGSVGGGTAIRHLKAIRQPTRWDNFEGDQPKLEGLVVEVTYSDGSVSYIEDPGEFTVKGGYITLKYNYGAGANGPVLAANTPAYVYNAHGYASANNGNYVIVSGTRLQNTQNWAYQVPVFLEYHTGNTVYDVEVLLPRVYKLKDYVVIPKEDYKKEYYQYVDVPKIDDIDLVGRYLVEARINDPTGALPNWDNPFYSGSGLAGSGGGSGSSIVEYPLRLQVYPAMAELDFVNRRINVNHQVVENAGGSGTATYFSLANYLHESIMFNQRSPVWLLDDVYRVSSFKVLGLPPLSDYPKFYEDFQKVTRLPNGTFEYFNEINIQDELLSFYARKGVTLELSYSDKFDRVKEGEKRTIRVSQLWEEDSDARNLSLRLPANWNRATNKKPAGDPNEYMFITAIKFRLTTQLTQADAFTYVEDENEEPIEFPMQGIKELEVGYTGYTTFWYIGDADAADVTADQRARSKIASVAGLRGYIQNPTTTGEQATTNPAYFFVRAHYPDGSKPREIQRLHPTNRWAMISTTNQVPYIEFYNEESNTNSDWFKAAMGEDDTPEEYFDAMSIDEYDIIGTGAASPTDVWVEVGYLSATAPRFKLTVNYLAPAN